MLRQERLKQQLEMERDSTVHVLQLEIKDLQQQLRLAEQAGAEARTDNARLKQEQQEDSRATEVSSPLCLKATVRSNIW